MSAVKVDFTIPSEVEEQLRRHVEAGQRSSFVAAAIRERLLELERQRLAQEMERGYLEMTEEHIHAVDLAFEAQAKVMLGGS